MIEVTPKNLIDWIGDRKGKYDYVDNRNCAVAQYLKDHGIEKPYVAGDDLYSEDGNGDTIDGMTYIGKISMWLDSELCSRPNGFASLKKRLIKAEKEMAA